MRPRPRKPGLKLSLRDDDSLWREPWWNAGRRARPIAEGRRKPPYPWRAPHAACMRDLDYCVCRRSASLFLFFVARVSAAKPGMDIEASRSFPDFAALIRATTCRCLTSRLAKLGRICAARTDFYFISPL